jgi:hypothetical protein
MFLVKKSMSVYRFPNQNSNKEPALRRKNQSRMPCFITGLAEDDWVGWLFGFVVSLFSSALSFWVTLRSDQFEKMAIVSMIMGACCLFMGFMAVRAYFYSKGGRQ